MKWYWIVLIALAAVAVGLLIGKAMKPKNGASSPANATGTASTTNPLAGKPAISVASANGVEITKDTNADGSAVIALTRTAG